ncbi:AIP1-1 [Symbiodinium natans]|uniref:AIP1-1 protein n=1 Tax=Symbiodinium natans TaxID=878477 RepID=A0A812KPH6_9DINO|nr:AIP1-1 [Symbiodinium natans]
MAQTLRVIPPLPTTERGTSCSITCDKAGELLLYCSGSNVIWRPVSAMAAGTEKPEEVFCWRGHVKNTTCAAMSPNGQWVASGDVTGAVRVWGAKGDHAQKNEYRLWDGVVKDVAWSDDNGRLVAAGDGKEVRAAAMIWDTGSKTGEVSGHTKQVNSIAFRSQRPFRVVTGGEDMQVIFHQGPPFKFARSYTNHSNFVNSVRYSPDGAWFASAGSDSKLCLYEGKEGEFLKEFAKPEGVSGSFWAMAWSPDSSQIVTAGGDKKLRIWDREAAAQVAEASVGTGLGDMQVGVSWASSTRVVSVCLDGRLLLWDVATGLSLAGTVNGTQGPLNCLACDKKLKCLVYGGTEGSVAIAPASGPTIQASIGKGIQHVLGHSDSFAGKPEAWIISLDDCIRKIGLESGEVSAPVEVKEFMVGAGWLDAGESKLIVATGKRNFHCVSDSILWSKAEAVKRRPTAFASLAGKKVAVALEQPEGQTGGMSSAQYDIQLLDIADETADGLVEKAVLQRHLAEVCALRFSPTGEHLASSDAAHKIVVWGLMDEVPVAKISDWNFHTARVGSLDWLEGGQKLVSGSLDRHLFVWDIRDPASKVQIKDTHKGGVTAVAAVSDSSFASAGHDGFVLLHGLS